MKIILCGKGGCGKSTVASMLARECAARGMRVLVVDTDESNFGLHRQLGCQLPEDFTKYFGGRRGVMSTTKNADVRDELFGARWDIDDIPKDYVTECDGVRMVAIGKIHEAGEGCACAMGVLARNFLPNLVLQEKDVVIIDAEAGVEHFGRGVDNGVDHILMIADPSYESICLSAKIGEMADSLGKPMHIVLNKVDEEQEMMMRETVEHPEKILAAVHQNREVLKKGLRGEKLDVSVDAVKKIADALFA